MRMILQFLLSPLGLQEVFNVYDEFSDVSGLFHNVDKTEILNLSYTSTSQCYSIRSGCSFQNLTVVKKLESVIEPSLLTPIVNSLIISRIKSSN